MGEGTSAPKHLPQQTSEGEGKPRWNLVYTAHPPDAQELGASVTSGSVWEGGKTELV